MSSKQLETIIRKLVSEQFRRMRDRTSQPFEQEDEIEDYFNSDLDQSDVRSKKKSPEELRSFWDVMMTEDALSDDDKEDE